jgi:23S rRNA (adenine-N6)-dimethyltransferase
VSGPTGRWGWHQLEPSWATRLVALADVSRGDLVLDVGAGHGVITDALLRAGAHVVAIELHAARAASLRERFAGRPVKVVRADAADLCLPRRPFTVVANPPFAATTALLRRLTSRGSRLERAALVVPSWAAARWASGRGAGGSAARRAFTCSLGPRVPVRAFRPPPPADARVLLLRSTARSATTPCPA